MISKNISNTKNYDNQLFNIINSLCCKIQAHEEVNGYEVNEEFLNKIYHLAREWNKIFTESCHSQGGF